MKLKHYWGQNGIASTMAGIAQNGKKRLIFTVVLQVRMKIRAVFRFHLLFCVGARCMNHLQIKIKLIWLLVAHRPHRSKTKGELRLILVVPHKVFFQNLRAYFQYQQELTSGFLNVIEKLCVSFSSKVVEQTYLSMF